MDFGIYVIKEFPTQFSYLNKYKRIVHSKEKHIFPDHKLIFASD